MRLIKTLMMVTASFLVVTSVSAAELMTHEAFKKVSSQYREMGTVSVSGEDSTSDAKAELIKKADEKGADVLVLASGHTENKIHASAKIYKKK